MLQKFAWLILGFVIATGSVCFTGCQEGAVEEAAEEIDDEIDDATTDY